eukprot:TRINITY_DN45113_c0_g1_i1.p1 TRINITY_DN45113_c0_g1~~TRINITY_DN45113_c0_g1_i1.p1  ORF type:complete len:219 (-),score=7.97 TRINITY_DN45113_c0_g1_i1:41-661(-)
MMPRFVHNQCVRFASRAVLPEPHKLPRNSLCISAPRCTAPLLLRTSAPRLHPLGLLARVAAFGINIVSSATIQAFVDTAKRASSGAGHAGAAGAANAHPFSNFTLQEPMTVSEACRVLDVPQLKGKKMSADEKAAVDRRHKHLLDANRVVPLQSGSTYLRERVHDAWRFLHTNHGDGPPTWPPPGESDDTATEGPKSSGDQEGRAR